MAQNKSSALTAAAVIVIVQGALGALFGILLLAASTGSAKGFLGTLGQNVARIAGGILLAVSIFLIAIGVGLTKVQVWARIAAFVVEGLSVLGSLRERGGVISLALAVAVVVLLALPSTSEDFRKSGAMPTAPPPSGPPPPPPAF